MSPSTNQSGNDTDEYDSPADRVCAEWGEQALLRLHPMGEANARRHLGAANKHDRSTRVKEHFAEVVRKHTE